MKLVEFAPIRLTEAAEIYSIRIDGDTHAELQKFLIRFKDENDEFLKDDLYRIAEAIRKMAELSILERFFRPEGKLTDRVYALPLEIRRRNIKEHGTLRLYCLRISDKLLIIGGGGLKTEDKYEDNSTLLSYVKTLQEVDYEMTILERNGVDIEQDILNIRLFIE